LRKKYTLVFVAISIVLFVIALTILYHKIIATLIPPIPPKISYQLSEHNKGILKEFFKSCNWTGYKSKLVKACDFSNTQVRNFAVKLAGKSSGDFNIGQVCDIFDYCYGNWKYVNDPTSTEYVAFASETITNNFNGDCDDFAVLICSSILAIGGEARLNFAFQENSGHAFTEINLGKTNTEKIIDYVAKRYLIFDGVWFREDKQGNKWLNLDWFAQHPGGKYFEYNKGTTFYIIQNYCEDFEK
jgi:hypothetical protein